MISTSNILSLSLILISLKKFVSYNFLRTLFKSLMFKSSPIATPPKILIVSVLTLELPLITISVIILACELTVAKKR